MRTKQIGKRKKAMFCSLSFLPFNPSPTLLSELKVETHRDIELKVDSINMKGSGVSADLLVCFPSRAHLPVMPKPLCSPSRAMDSAKRHPVRPAARGRASPLLFKTKSKTTTDRAPPSPELDEPSSPKVTCAGQIKVRRSKHAPRPRPSAGAAGSWLEALGLKKEIGHLLGALRGLRFGCFAPFHGTVECTSEDEDEDEEENDEVDNVLSNWFKELEEKDVNGVLATERKEQTCGDASSSSSWAPPPPPPSNALLLMRCRSAPATRRWSQRAQVLMEDEEEEEEEEEGLVVMGYSPEFLKVSSEIVKETWLVGSNDPLARSRSWKR